MSRLPALRVQVLDPATLAVEATLDNSAHAPKAVAEHNGLGGVSVSVHNIDVDMAEMVDGRVLRAQILDDFDAGTYTTVGQGVYKREKSTTIALEPSDRRLTASALGMLWEFTQEIVEGPGPSPFDDKVRLDWTWPDLDRSAWTAAVQRSVVGDRSALPPDGLAGIPRNFPNPLAYWISPNAASGADPDGDWYAHFEYTSSEIETWVIYVTADDGFELALDNVPGDFRALDDTGDAAAYSWYWKVRVPAGDHSIDLHVRNLERDTENNCSMAAVAVARTILTEDGYDEEWIFTTSDSGWVCLDYGEPTPGVTPGIALSLLLPTGWSASFTDDEDSDGQTWDSGPMVLDAYESKWTLARRISDAGWCDIAADPETRTLHAWVSRGQNRPAATFANGTNIIRAEYDTDTSEQVTGLAVRDLFGWFMVGDDSGAVAKLNLGDISDRDEATRQGEAKLAELVEPLDSITLDVACLTAATTPGIGFDVGDTIQAPGRDGVSASWRVLAWTLTLNRLGGLDAKLQLNSLSRDRVERLERASKRSTAGTLGGRSLSAAPTSPFQQRAGKLVETTWEWSWSGAASDLDNLVGPPIRFDRPYRLQRFDLLANTANTGATEIDLLINGDVEATVTASSGSVDGESTFLVVVGPGDVATVEMTTQGGHDTATLTLVGSPMP